MQWTCTAPDGGLLDADGAIDGCFLEDTLGRCRNRRQCQSRVREERERLLARLNELAEDGSPIFASVASKLPLPDALLGLERAEERAVP